MIVFFHYDLRLQLEARLGITQAKSPTDAPPELPAVAQSQPTQPQNHHQQQQQHPDDGKRKSARRKE